MNNNIDLCELLPYRVNPLLILNSYTILKVLPS